MRVVMVTVAAAACAWVLPAPAVASPPPAGGAGNPCTAGAKHGPKRNAGPGRAPVFIGDSTGIIAAPLLAGLGYRADAKGCRQYTAAIGMISRLRRAHRLPRVVVVALGVNGPIPPGAIGRTVKAMGGRGKLVLVTPRRQGTSRARMLAAGRKLEKRVKVFDWARYSAGKPWFAGDGIHVSHFGAKKYAQYLKPALKYLRR